MILPEVQIVEAHDVLGLDPSDVLRSVGETAAAAPRFIDLEKDMWRRGRYAPSLFAASDARSFAWLGRAIGEGMPLLPLVKGQALEADAFWTRLARENAR